MSEPELATVRLSSLSIFRSDGKQFSLILWISARHFDLSLAPITKIESVLKVQYTTLNIGTAST